MPFRPVRFKIEAQGCSGSSVLSFLLNRSLNCSLRSRERKQMINDSTASANQVRPKGKD